MKDTSRKKIGPFKLNRIYNKDCIAAMRELPDNSIDIAIADPPYNLSKGGNWSWDNSVKLAGFGGKWGKMMENWDDMTLKDYLNFSISWLNEIKRVVKPTGSFWVHGTYHNIGLINFSMQILNIEMINEVIWFKRNSFPNLSGRRLTASHETILWAHTGEDPKKREYLFNYEESKLMNYDYDGLKAPGKQMRTVWDIPNNKKATEIKFGKHPSQKPIRLIERMIELSSKKDQVCLVPFSGAGSECLAASICGLHFIAFETNQEYIEISNKRISYYHEDKGGMKTAKTKKPVQLKFDIEKDFQHNDNTKEKLKKEKKVVIPSLIKWTGSKRSQANEIFRYVPSYNRYYEPFLGGGSLLYLTEAQNAIAADIYKPLIDFWKLVKTEPELIVASYKKHWTNLQNDLPDYFYTIRDHFNNSYDPLDLSFLARTCVNGIIRFNKDGKFNNSFHLSRKGMNPDRYAPIVKKWTEKIKGVTFICADFADALSTAQGKDFVYMDPPYAGNHQRYTSDLNLEDFFSVLENLNDRGVYWALSFDGTRGEKDLIHPVPKELYKRHILLHSGNSAVKKVLGGKVEKVFESLYVNY